MPVISAQITPSSSTERINSWRKGIRTPSTASSSTLSTSDTHAPTSTPGPSASPIDMSTYGRYNPNTLRPPPSYHTMQVPYDQQNESEPLLRNNNNWPLNNDWSTHEPRVVRHAMSIVIMLILVLGLESGYIWANMNSVDIYNPQERARIRRGWEHECTTYAQNITRLTLERDKMRHDWNMEHERLSTVREDIARQEQKWEEERQKWEEERQKHEKEERDRQRKLIQWGEFRRDQEPCISFGTARYQAYLEYVPPGWDTYTACKETSIHIHERDVFPTECRFDGTKMTGIWIIDFNEPGCKPWWRDTRDHGCTSRQSGFHRYEAHLEGYLEPNEHKNNWADMCSTTPHTMFGHTSKSPSDCVFWPRLGVYGFWDIPDEHCR